MQVLKVILCYIAPLSSTTMQDNTTTTIVHLCMTTCYSILEIPEFGTGNLFDHHERDECHECSASE